MFFMPIGDPRWPPPQDMGKYSNAFFSETTNMIKAKLYMQVVSEKKHFETFFP
jgi:hypothetical protein